MEPLTVDEDATSVGQVPDDGIDQIILRKCPLLNSEIPKLKELLTEQKILVYLLTKNITENNHVEFKKSPTVATDSEMLRCACAMYNANDPSLREPSLTDHSKLSSYMIVGFDERAKKLAPFDPPKRFKDPAQIEHIFYEKTKPQMKVVWFLVHFDSTIIIRDLEFPKGHYGILEVPQRNVGPISCCFKGRWVTFVNDGTSCRDVSELDRACQRDILKRFSDGFDENSLKYVSLSLKDHFHSFRVLVLTKSTSDDSLSADFEYLFRAIGRGKWSIIFDFDRDSRKPGGHCTVIEEEMNAQYTPKEQHSRSYSLKIWTELEKGFNDDEILECQKSTCTIYVQAAGCVRSDGQDEIEEPKNEAKLKRHLRALIESVFKNNESPKKVLCFSLFLESRSDQSSPIGKPDFVPSLVQEAYSSVDGKDDDFESIVMFSSASVRDSQKTKLGNYFVAPVNQLSAEMNSLYPAPLEKPKMELPGLSGRFSVSLEEFAPYANCIRLYHLRAGEYAFQDLSHDEKMEKTKLLARQFLAGSELTEEMLYIECINGAPQVFVKRRNHVDDLKERTIVALENAARPFAEWKRQKQIVDFYHEPVSGATTIARIVMWKLRESYPCIEVVKENEIALTVDGVRFICEAARKPVLVLFDSKISTRLDVRTFATKLNESEPKPQFATLFVQRDKSHEGVLSVELSSDEYHGFAAIHKDVGGDYDVVDEIAEKDCTPFLFSFYYYRNNYKKINDFLESVLKDISVEANRLLYFACFSQIFTDKPLPLAIAASCLGLSPAQGEPSRTLQTLGAPRYLIIVKESENDFALSPVPFIETKLLQKLFRCSDSTADRMDEIVTDEHINMFVSYLCAMANKGTELLLPCLEKMVQLLLTCKKRREHSQVSLFFSTVFRCLPNHEAFEAICQKLSGSFKKNKPHILIHCARCFAYECKDYSKSIELVHRALGVEDGSFITDTSCNDVTVLGLAAHLINCRLDSGTELQFEEFEQLCCQSMRLSKKAQRKSYSMLTKDYRYKAHPFYIEIQAQRTLLNRFYFTECNKNVENFFRRMKEPGFEEMHTAHENILENIFKLEKMLENDEIHYETVISKNLDQISETKYEFARRTRQIANAPVGQYYSDMYAWVAFDVLYWEKLKADTSESHSGDDEAAGGTLKEDEGDPNQYSKYLTYWDRTLEAIKWSKAEKQGLLDVLLKCQARLPKNDLEACVLLIMLKPPKALMQSSLETAIEIAENWCRKPDSNFQAHFMYGIFQLASALTVTDVRAGEKAFRLAESSLVRCKNAVCRTTEKEGRIRWLKGSKRPRIFLRKDSTQIGTVELLPSKQAHEEQIKHIWRNNGLKLSGYLNGEGHVLCKELYNYKLWVPKGSATDEMHKKKRKVYFALALAYSGLIPVDIQPA